MMNEILTLVLALVTGVLLGTLFFGGLWWTVRKGVSSKQPVFWFFGSLLLRTSVVLIGFYFIAGGRWERLLVCLLGFVMVRLIVTLRLRSGQAWLTSPPGEHHNSTAQEAGHAT
jgi:F1F0 ATPase subunit 2